MYRLMIVDDERLVREGLRKKVDWARLGIEPCCVADDGDTAMPLIQTHRPDILLTDVRMRRMNGLELCNCAKQLLPDLEVVFISGYSDSDYIRQALRLEAVDYVYKPVNLQEVERVMRRVVEKLDERTSRMAAQRRTQELLQKSLPLLQERFLNDWFQGMIPSEAETRRQMEQLQLPCRPDLPFTPLVFAIDSAPVDVRLAQLTLCEALRRTFPDVLLCCAGSEVQAILQDPPPNMIQMLEGLLQELKRGEGVQSAVGTGSAVSELSAVPSAMQAAHTALRHRFFLNSARVIFFDSEDWHVDQRLPLKLPDLLEEHLRSGREEALKSCISSELEKAQESQQIEQTRMLLIKIAFTLDEALESCGAEGGLAYAFCRRAFETGTFSQLKEQLWQLVHEACSRMERLQQSRSQGVKEAVRAIIDQRLGEKLTIERIAQELHYSPTYLCLLYKQETGETIGDTLAASRIREAMRLLRETDEMIYQIAVRVGYPEQAHFAKLFKRATGMTPGEYRRQA